MSMSLPFLTLATLLPLIHVNTPLVVLNEEDGSPVTVIEGSPLLESWAVQGIRTTENREIMVIVRPC